VSLNLIAFLFYPVYLILIHFLLAYGVFCGLFTIKHNFFIFSVNSTILLDLTFIFEFNSFFECYWEISVTGHYKNSDPF